MGKVVKRRRRKDVCRLSDVIDEGSILIGLKAKDREGVIQELVGYLAERRKIPKSHTKTIVRRILKREEEGSTGIGNSVAIPHLKQYEGVKEMVGVFGCSSGGVDFNAVDGALCHLFFLLITPKEQTEGHIEVLRRVASLARDAELCAYLRTVKDVKKMKRILYSLDDS